MPYYLHVVSFITWITDNRLLTICMHDYDSLSSATIVPEVSAAGARHWKGQLGGAGKQESGDSAYGEGIIRGRLSSSMYSYNYYNQIILLIYLVVEETANGAAELVQRQNNNSPNGHS